MLVIEMRKEINAQELWRLTKGGRRWLIWKKLSKSSSATPAVIWAWIEQLCAMSLVAPMKRRLARIRELASEGGSVIADCIG